MVVTLSLLYCSLIFLYLNSIMKKVITLTIMSCVLVALNGCFQPQTRVRSSAAPQPNHPSSVAKKSPAVPSAVQRQDSLASFDLDGTESNISVETVSVEKLLPSLEYINTRIDVYGGKLERWKELDKQSLLTDLNQKSTEQMVSCFRRLQKVVGGYTALREWQLRMGYSTPDAGKPELSLHEVQELDIAFLEGPCGRILAENGAGPFAGGLSKEQQSGLARFESLLEKYSKNKEYEQVLQTWMQIPQTELTRVSIPAKIYYADALMFLHQEEGAAKIYLDIVTQMSSKEQSTDLISLRKKLADLYTASGNYGAAKEQYQKIAGDYQAVGIINDWAALQLSILSRSVNNGPELQAYSALLRNYLGFIPEKDGYKVVWQADKFLESYPYSAVLSNVDIIKATSQAKADAWFGKSMGEAANLAKKKKYQQAVDTLKAIPDDIIDDSHRSEKKTRTNELALAEAVERETHKLEELQELQRKWNSGMLLVKGKRFDEAIDLFTEMLDTEYGPRAKKKIAEVSLLAARSDRRRAADVFSRYTKAGDLESKKKLLISSRRILKDILVKYPEVEIIAKVQSNIARVEEEMNRLDPNLIFIADQGGALQSREAIDVFEMTPDEEQFSEDSLPIIERSLP